ncbi:MAG: 3'(2'),5'-bisphosphate nucleotidase CysQ [Planctomycetota bacterium]|jgi:3'(2'), 5'-bisphosphate nucleotidase|nr:3'(2'),5'-bisphosphate nucleotidase CysQ [Planctomycetota bacterium]
MKCAALLDPVAALVAEAGAAAMVHYGVARAEAKADGSPVTAADLAAHEVLLAGLPGILDVPVLSEESAAVAYAERHAWQRYWLVDPIDGTKEFLKGNGEFTVNVALVVDGYPVLGVVGAPALGCCYAGVVDEAGSSAWRVDAAGRGAIRAQRRVSGPLRVVASKSHRNQALEDWLATLGEIDEQAVGSSLKFCLVAEGRADHSPRLGRTMEWDTAAGQAVAEAAGARVTDFAGQRLRYNKPDLANPDFRVDA